MPGYGIQGPAVIKHINIATWAPEGAKGLAPVLAQVTSDLIKLRKNYLVHDVLPWALDNSATCAKGIDGVVLVRIMDAHTEPPQDVTLHGALTLMRCGDLAEVFRTEGQVTTAVQDKSLEELAATYRHQLGDIGGQWAAPAFGLVQALAEPLPDPHLSEQDIEAKIELGALVSAQKIIAG
jgi:probable lipoprotein (TIGR04455 family)